MHNNGQLQIVYWYKLVSEIKKTNVTESLKLAIAYRHCGATKIFGYR